MLMHADSDSPAASRSRYTSIYCACTAGLILEVDNVMRAANTALRRLRTQLYFEAAAEVPFFTWFKFSTNLSAVCYLRFSSRNLLSM